VEGRGKGERSAYDADEDDSLLPHGRTMPRAGARERAD
jgi:hypothetical protein